MAGESIPIRHRITFEWAFIIRHALEQGLMSLPRLRVDDGMARKIIEVRANLCVRSTVI